MAQIQQSGVLLKQSTSYIRLLFFVTTGQTVAVNLSKAGAAFGAASGSPATELANGWYKLLLNAADTNTIGDLAYHCTAGSGGPLDFSDQIQSQIFQDLQINPTGQAVISSNVKQNVALNGYPFVMTTVGTGAPLPNLGSTITAQRSAAGAGFTPCTNVPFEIANGWYGINLSASDLNSPVIGFKMTAPGANDTDFTIITQP